MSTEFEFTKKYSNAFICFNPDALSITTEEEKRELEEAIEEMFKIADRLLHDDSKWPKNQKTSATPQSLKTEDELQKRIRSPKND